MVMVINPLDIVFYILIFRIIGCTFNSKINVEQEKKFYDAVHLIAWVAIIYYSILLVSSIPFYVYKFKSISIKMRIVGLFTIFMSTIPLIIAVLMILKLYKENTIRKVIIFLMWFYITCAILIVRLGIQLLELADNNLNIQQIFKMFKTKSKASKKKKL